MGGGEVVGVELVALHVGLFARVDRKGGGAFVSRRERGFDIPCDQRGVSQRVQ